jgi:hypothetical protein
MYVHVPQMILAVSTDCFLTLHNCINNEDAMTPIVQYHLQL